MSDKRVLIIGDGPLAAEISELLEDSDYDMQSILLNQDGEEFISFEGLLDMMNGEFDIAIEAMLSDIFTKQEVIVALDSILPPDKLILASTLNVSATEAAGWTNFGSRVVGWGALPPLFPAEVFEVSLGLRTDPVSVSETYDFFAKLGKEAVLVGDSVGGVLGRTVTSLINNAAYALFEGVASAEDIDQAMKLGTNYPHGPLAWADIIGIDQVVGILNAMSDTFGPQYYQPCPMLKQLHEAQFWGIRTGRGFYEYNEDDED